MISLGLVALITAAAVVAAVMLWRAVARRGREQQQARKVNEYVETRRRMDAVDRSGDPDDLREWLRQRAAK